uniref:Protein SSUH2-like protein n=1 Tax=Magallana gigas TaxID=29159 RepID=A0A8W8IYX5_MAGGI
MAKEGAAINEQTTNESEQVFIKDVHIEDNDHKPEVNFDTVSGYDHIRTDESLLPPPPTEFTAPKDDVKPTFTFTSAPVISEDTARQALVEFVSKQRCWGTGTAKNLTFEKLQPSHSYHILLGQFVDGSQNGSAPGPWEIPATFTEIFKNEIQHHEVPHTAFVKVNCSSCNGSGSRTVTRNGKSCRESCHCSGGKVSCLYCRGNGKVRCPACKGECRLKWFIKLIISWVNNVSEHVIERGVIPAYMISQSTGTLGFNEVLPRVPPVANFPVAEVNEVSHNFVDSHQFPMKRIHMQHHMIRMVPLTQCVCRRRGKEFTFFVYGLENKVYAPDYPDQCCWGCTIQ